VDIAVCSLDSKMIGCRYQETLIPGQDCKTSREVRNHIVSFWAMYSLLRKGVGL
jgi:hypothetical protein